jgi:hypothetical protein
MCFIGSGHPQLCHNDPAQIDNMRTLFGSQCREGVRGQELIIMIVKGQESEREKATNLEKECTSEARPDKEKVWRVWYVARRVHIIQPQIKQGKRGFHALCTDN